MTGTELVLLHKVGAPLAKEGLSRFLHAYAERAEDILCARIAKGKLYEIADSKFASALFKYLRLGLEGTARVNLDLLAQVIAGAGDLDQRTFHLSDFRRWSKVLAELTREEIIVLGRTAAVLRELEADQGESSHRAHRLEKRLINDLVGPNRPFALPGQVRATLSALQRFGLFLQVSLFGSNPQDPSPLFDELIRLVNFDDAMTRYGTQDEADDEG